MKNLSAKARLVLSIFVPMTLFLFGYLFYTYTNLTSILMDQKKAAIQNYIKGISNAYVQLEEKVEAGHLTRKEAQKQAIHMTESFRYGKNNSDYFWVNDKNAVIVYHPKKSLIGKDLSKFKDKEGGYLFTNFVKVALANKNGGFKSYLWNSKEDPKKLTPKLSFVRYFEKWDWVVGTGIYIEDVRREVMKTIQFDAIMIIICFTLIMCLILFTADTYILKPVKKVVQDLDDQNNSLVAISSKVKETSHVLNSNAQKQASSLEHTVSSLNEITSMVNKTSDEAETTLKLSNQSRDYADDGKETMNNLLDAIEKIKETSSHTANAVQQNNDDVKGILNLITEIREKTKVINDIVFQTKLLSFNASVESARAGEHGKGFAVVAEEVGNLANMSGKSSTEIESILSDNILKIESIVSSAEEKVKQQIQASDARIDQGIEIGRLSSQAFDNILNVLGDVNSSIHEVTVATNEQSIGVKEINEAMMNFEKMNLDTTENSKKTAEIATNLNEESELLTKRLGHLNNIIYGKSA